MLTPERVGAISFFCNAGIRFIEEMCKLRAFGVLWDRITRERYGVSDERYRRFRYGLQVNSLGLTASQPENNVYRVLLEMLGATLSKNGRARAVQLPAWNEALGLPRPWDQQWSLRAQQILANETDLLEYEDLFEGSPVVQAKVDELAESAQAELDRILALGGSLKALPEMKERLVAEHARRLRSIDSGETTVVGINAFEVTEPSPLQDDGDMHILKVPAETQAHQVDRLAAFRAQRDAGAVADALDRLRDAAASGENVMPASIQAARSGVTTGEWAAVLREVFGDYRAPTGLGGSSASAPAGSEALVEARRRVSEAASRLGVPRLRMLVGKPGLDGHSNGAEQVAVRARDLGIEVVYPGIRLTPDEVAGIAADEDVHLIGLSVLSGAHDLVVPEVIEALRRRGVDLQRVPVVVGGIIPDDDAAKLLELGVSRVFTPKDHDLTRNLVESVGFVGA